MEKAYAERNLVRNDSKCVRLAATHTLWGAHLDGVIGRVSAPPFRIIALTMVTLEIAWFGFASVGLLDLVAGTWNSILLYRRRMLCLLDLVYDAVRSRHLDEVLRLSQALRFELFSLAVTSCCAWTNQRATVIDKVYAADASLSKIAACVAAVPHPVAKELRRHCLKRGTWTRLLHPARAWLRHHQLLAEGEEVADDQRYPVNSIWVDVLRCADFEVLKVVRAASRTHVNILEVQSVLLVEAELAATVPCSYASCIGDSQVAEGCLVKGRSASPALNGVMVRGLPVALGGDIYLGHAWGPSRVNVADDPTRSVPLRKPCQEPPLWWHDLVAGSFDTLDAIVADNDAESASRGNTLAKLERYVSTASLA